MPAAIPKPSLVVVACVRNEADIIEAFVRHHLVFAERILLLDQGSVDGTREILRQLVLEGLPLEVISEARLGNFQAEWTTRLLRSAAIEAHGGWIAALDADAFLGFEGDALRLPPLSEKPLGLELRMRTYLASPDDCAEVLNPVERMTRRLVSEPGNVSQLLIPAALARDGWVNQGNHRFMWRGEWLPTQPAEGIFLAHFPSRSAGQSAAKTATIYLQSIVHTSFAGHVLDYNREPFLQLQQSLSAFRRGFPGSLPRYLKQATARTVRDPLQYRGAELRYTSAVNDEDRLATVLAGHAAALANALASSTAEEREEAMPILLRIGPSWGGNGDISWGLSPKESEIGKFWIELPPGRDDSASLQVEVNGERGALKLHSVTFFSANKERLVWAGPSVEKAVDRVSGGLKWKTPGCLYVLKPIGKTTFRIALPSEEIFPGCTGVELAFSFEDNVARLGARITASSAHNFVPPKPPPKPSPLQADQEQLGRHLIEAERNLAALRVAHDALQRTSVFFEAKARDAQASLMFLKWNPLNKLMLAARRTWSRKGRGTREAALPPPKGEALENAESPRSVLELFELLHGREVRLLSNAGNAGDAIIARGCRELGARHCLALREFAFPQPASGNILLVQGSGNLCAAYHTILPALEKYIPCFRRVFMLPSSLDPECPAVRKWLEQLPSHVTVFCRDLHSYEAARAAAPQGRFVLDHDMAFHVNFQQWQRPGNGNLNAFRTDREGVGGFVPEDNFDLPAFGTGAEEDDDLLPDLIADYATVQTDHAHVAIVAALLGKETHIYPNNYHKLRGIYEFSLRNLPNTSFHETSADAASWCAAHPVEVQQSRERRETILRLLAHTPRSARPSIRDKAPRVPA